MPPANPALRLSVLSALLSIGVVMVAVLAPELTILAASVSALSSVLLLVTGGGASGTTGPLHRGSSKSTLVGQEDYELVDKVSEGGIGEVFRARQLHLGRLVALKRIKPGRLSTDEQARFRREARVLSGLSNPHTINVFDAGIQSDGTLFYVMELLDGLNLRQLVERAGPVVPARVIHILYQAALSLLEAHGKDFVHRDLNPANLMICRYGGDYDFVKVLDFGLVKSMTPSAPSEDVFETQAGEIPGTPAFLAPESITGGGPPTVRADIYALGAIAHYLLTGKLLFDADTPVAIARAQLHEIPRRPSETSPHQVPQALDDLIMRCLEKDPARRPRNVREFLELLEELKIAHPWTRAQAEEKWHDVPLSFDARDASPRLPSDASAS